MTVKLTPIGGGLQKDVQSTFYSTNESIIPDGTQRPDKDGKKITHKLEGGKLVTDIASVRWNNNTQQ